MKLEPHRVGGERSARQSRPLDRALAFLDPLFARPALIVEGDDPVGRARQVGDDETDARIKLAGMPFDFGASTTAVAKIQKHRGVADEAQRQRQQKAQVLPPRPPQHQTSPEAWSGFPSRPTNPSVQASRQCCHFSAPPSYPPFPAPPRFPKPSVLRRSKANTTPGSRIAETPPPAACLCKSPCASAGRWCRWRNCCRCQRVLGCKARCQDCHSCFKIFRGRGTLLIDHLLHKVMRAAFDFDIHFLQVFVDGDG